MTILSINKGICLGLILAGIGLMSAALFLHPMSPEDFLEVLLSNPLQTVGDVQGGSLALMFWASAATCLAGMAGLSLCLLAIVNRHLHLASRHRALAN